MAAVGLVVAYGRVSTTSQADAGALERQEKQLLEGVTADEILMDVGSGKTTARPGYQRLIELVASGKVDRVLIKEQDRLNRNLKADLDFWELCSANGTSITDLHGREIEFRTPDGELLTTVVSALNQHRSRSYGVKIQNGLAQARKDGKPARPARTFPFGYRPLRDEGGRVIGVEPHPEQWQKARQRVDWFLEGMTLSALSRRVLEEQGDKIAVTPTGNWLRHPYLRGRLCWGSDQKGGFAEVADTPTFQPLITDVEAELIQQRLADTKHNQALGNRKRRMLSGTVACADCGYRMAYRVSDRASKKEYLQCKHRYCPRRGKSITADLVCQVLQFSLHQHAAALAPLLDKPAVDPPEVAALQSAIDAQEKMLATVPEVMAGTIQAGIDAARAEIVKLRSKGGATPQWILLAAVQSQTFWLQDDAKINRCLQAMGCLVTAQLGMQAKEAKVTSIRFSTAPAEAPLPPDQENILIPVTRVQLKALGHQDKIQAAMAAMG